MELLGSLKLHHGVTGFKDAVRLPLMNLPSNLIELHEVIKSAYVGKLGVTKFIMESVDRAVYVTVRDIEYARGTAVHTGYVAVIKDNDQLTQLDYITGPSNILNTLGLMEWESCNDISQIRTVLKRLSYNILLLTDGTESTNFSNSSQLSLDDIQESLKNNEGVALPHIQQYIDRGLLDPNLVRVYRDSVVLSNTILNAITLKG